MKDTVIWQRQKSKAAIREQEADRCQKTAGPWPTPKQEKAQMDSN